jgi:hypothetical protein
MLINIKGTYDSLLGTMAHTSNCSPQKPEAEDHVFEPNLDYTLSSRPA